MSENKMVYVGEKEKARVADKVRSGQKLTVRHAEAFGMWMRNGRLGWPTHPGVPGTLSVVKDKALGPGNSLSLGKVGWLATLQ